MEEQEFSFVCGVEKQHPCAGRRHGELGKELSTWVVSGTTVAGATTGKQEVFSFAYNEYKNTAIRNVYL